MRFARLVERLPLEPARREAVGRALRRERQAGETLGDVWILRAHPGSRLRELFRQTRLARMVVLFASTYVVDYGLFVLSWWLVGRGALRGQIDMGWLVAWTFLFATMLPFRMLSTWYEGRSPPPRAGS